MNHQDTEEKALPSGVCFSEPLNHWTALVPLHPHSGGGWSLETTLSCLHWPGDAGPPKCYFDAKESLNHCRDRVNSLVFFSEHRWTPLPCKNFQPLIDLHLLDPFGAWVLGSWAITCWGVIPSILKILHRCHVFFVGMTVPEKLRAAVLLLLLLPR